MRNALVKAVLAHMGANRQNLFVAGVGERYSVPDGVQGRGYPSAASFIVSDNDGNVMGERRADLEWQVSLYTEGHDLAISLAGACATLFDGAKLCADGYAFTFIYLATFGPDRADSTEPFQTSITFYVRC